MEGLAAPDTKQGAETAPQSFQDAFQVASDHRHAAIDVQGLAGHVGSFIGSQIKYGRSDFGARSHALHGNGTHDGVFLLVVQLAGHRAFDEAGRHAVDGDVAGGDFLCQRLRKPIMPALEAQ